MVTPDPKKNSNHVSLGFNLAAGMALMTFIGFWIDQKRQSEPLWTIIFVLAGFGYCIYEIWKYIRDTNAGG